MEGTVKYLAAAVFYPMLWMRGFGTCSRTTSERIRGHRSDRDWSRILVHSDIDFGCWPGFLRSLIHHLIAVAAL
jgi:hypothetical protein